MADPRNLQKLPYDGFPLRRHRNGHWYKSVWNPRTKKSEQFYFGPWKDDPEGKRGMTDPEHGWLARRDAIKAGIDNPAVTTVNAELTLGELMGHFLSHKRSKVTAGELSLPTFGDYMREIQRFVTFMKPASPAGGLRPEHFTAYMKHLVEHRKLGRASRRRVRAYVTAFLRFGDKNGWINLPKTGSDWVAPATDPDSMRQAKARSGEPDYSARILTGKELRKLLRRAQPAFKAMILLGANCGLGPADLGRLRWEMMDLESGRLTFPRPKTGVMRVGYLWKRTRKALRRVRQLKHNRAAIADSGESSLVFITRRGLPYYREHEIHGWVELAGNKVRKVVGVHAVNSITGLFTRMARELGIEGVTFYRLRHTFKTLGKRSRDSEALNAMMGHRDTTTGKVYDHNTIAFSRIKSVARVIQRRLWKDAKRRADTLTQRVMSVADHAEGESAAA